MALSKHSVILFKYIIISAFILLVCIAIISNMLRISIIESSQWQQKADSLKTSNIRMRALRGNILSCNDEILASTIPEFSLFLDFRVEGL
ncbi:MAG: penicillin-binding protein, partial [Bacteroidales bacterium]